MIEWLMLILLIPVILVPVVLLFGFAGCDLVFRIDPVEPPPTFETALDPEPELIEDRQEPNQCIVQRIEAARLSQGGSLVRITVQRPTNGDLNINALFISHAAETGNPYDSAGAPTAVPGAPFAVTRDPSNGLVELPPVEFTLDPTRALLLAFDIGSAGHVRRSARIDNSNATAFLGPFGEASLSTRSAGYSDRTDRVYIVQRIEVA